MKKILRCAMAIMLALTVVVTFTACGETEQAEKAVDDTMQALQDATYDSDSEAAKAVQSEFDSLNITGLDEQDFMKALFGNLKYEITGSEKKDSDTVDVTMKVTNVDMENAADKWVAQAKTDMTNTNSDLYQAILSGNSTQMYKTLYDMLFDAIDENKDKTVTSEITVTVNKDDDGNWQMDPTSSDIDKMCGNIMEAMTNINW
ncbi:MAG: hypothetical protein ACOYJH_05280 [Anaerovoracaceae bacterium]|jgi:hypothetical protein